MKRKNIYLLVFFSFMVGSFFFLGGLTGLSIGFMAIQDKLNGVKNENAPQMFAYFLAQILMPLLILVYRKQVLYKVLLIVLPTVFLVLHFINALILYIMGPILLLSLIPFIIYWVKCIRAVFIMPPADLTAGSN